LYELLYVGTTTMPDNTEGNLYSYDIMTRNCFGTYDQILKEMTFSPKMGEQFNYIDSSATRFHWDAWYDETTGVRKLVFPDENYAREVMQLFSIGLHELELDGTETRDKFGREIQTYDNVNIMNNARVMTGFTYTARRGNTEELFRATKSRFEPFRIDIDKHDFFPKQSIEDGWIGDRYPLCEDLPKHHFLKIGATYRFRGGSSIPTSQYMPASWDADEKIKRFVLSPDSMLYKKLCDPDPAGNCNFSNVVTLDENLNCFGNECSVDSVIIAQISPGAFYEYIRQPCTHFSFYNNGKKVVTGVSKPSPALEWKYTHAMCANPLTAVAARSCCGISVIDRIEYNYKFEYHGEVVSAGTNEAICIANGGTVCDPTSVRAYDPMAEIDPEYNAIYPSQNTYFWTDTPCKQQILVRNDGMVAIVHEPQANPSVTARTVLFVDASASINYISVPWNRDTVTGEARFPTTSNECGGGACTVFDDKCLCDITIAENSVFDALPSSSDALQFLHVGAIDPAVYDDRSYSLIESAEGIEAYALSGTSAINSTSTIFKVTGDFGEVFFLRNLVSQVTVGGTYVLRNPVGFIDLVKVEERDAEFEVDAFLNHLTRYSSSAPFICKRLIQFFGISNPSPAYVERVVKSYIGGFYTHRGTVFGDGRYGSLAATAAAITLDKESLAPVIDEDPVSGNVREPLLKVIHLMRSLRFERRPHIKLRYGLFDGLRSKIGQSPWEAPDQFSFFSGDYATPGLIASSELVSPESQLLSISNVIGLTNGLFSLHSYGLAVADGGLGPFLTRLPSVGDYSSSVGFLTYTTVNDISDKINDLYTLMTAGRLSDDNKQVLVDAYNYFAKAHGADTGERVLLQLMSALPEFHTWNTVRKTGLARSITPSPPKASNTYKAIVFINLFGGIDSFNVLTPHSNGGCYLYDDYFEARGGDVGVGLTLDEILPIDGSSAGINGCKTFGVNSLLPSLKDIYDEGRGLFFANMGHLHKPCTNKNWLTETRTDLFSHHTMKAEAHRVDAFKEGDGPGVLGRMLDVLEDYGLAVSATSVNAHSIMIDGSPTTGRLSTAMDTSGVPRVYHREFLKGNQQELRLFLEKLHSETQENSGAFSNQWSQSFIDIWNKTDTLVETLRGIKLSTDFSSKAPDIDDISKQMKLVAELIAAKDQRGNGVNRDVFTVYMGGFDGHSELKATMNNRLPALDNAIKKFWMEMKAQGISERVTVVIGSEFGRTTTMNSNRGSDHGWGGNYFAFGGDIKGGRILGEYPLSFTDSPDNPINLGRGRILPTRSWDALWFGVAQWFGINEPTDLDQVLPNSQNFGCDLFTDSDIFVSGQSTISGCGGVVETTDVSLYIPEPRYLTGKEQKDICRIAVLSSSKQLNINPSDSRCYISNQVIQESSSVPGSYEVSGSAVLNFDAYIPKEYIDKKKVNSVAAAASAFAADFVVADAIQITEAPSSSPTGEPTISPQPTSSPTPGPTESPAIEIPDQCLSILDGIRVVSSSSSSSKNFYGLDIGSGIASAGNFFFDSGSWVVLGTGVDIWGNSDSFHYMYMPTTGDITISMFVSSFTANHPWAKAGPMIRASLSPSSAHYSAFVLGSGSFTNQYRQCDGCTSVNDQTGVISLSSVWLRTKKTGNVLESFYKGISDAEWIPFGGTATIDYGESFYIGIAVTSHSSTTELASACGTSFETTSSLCSNAITESGCISSSLCQWGTITEKCYDSSKLPQEDASEIMPSIFSAGSTVETFNCADTDETEIYAIDGMTDSFTCIKSKNGDPGLIISPSHQTMSLVTKMRIYAGRLCPLCDPVRYKLYGRKSTFENFVEISGNDLPWKSDKDVARNFFSVPIHSTYSSGDNGLSFTEVSFENVEYYLDYKVEFSKTRAPQSSSITFAEIELPGLLMPESTGSGSNYSGELVLSTAPRCGATEVDARETCGNVCATNDDCVSGKFCYGVATNYCGSIPPRVYSNPIVSFVPRCGTDEISARTFCGEECKFFCSTPGEICHGVLQNYCGSEYTEVS